MPKVNLSTMAHALLRSGVPGTVPEAAHVDREAVAIVARGSLPAWDSPAIGVVTTVKAKAAVELVRVCESCGEEFKVTPQGQSLPTMCSACAHKR